MAFLNTSVPHVLQVRKMQDTFGKYPVYSHRLLSIASPTSLGMPDKYLDASLSMFSNSGFTGRSSYEGDCGTFRGLLLLRITGVVARIQQCIFHKIVHQFEGLDLMYNWKS